MSRGFGNIGRSPKVEPGTAATVTGANNGLGILGTDVIMMGPLIYDTNIDLNGQIFTFDSGIGEAFQLTPDKSLVYGDVSNITTGARARMDVPGEEFVIQFATNTYLDIDKGNDRYSIGDIDGVSGNGMTMRINDGTSVIDIGAIGGGFPGNKTFLQLSDANPNLIFFSNFLSYLSVDPSNDSYYLGDFGGGASGLVMSIDGPNSLVSLGDLNGGYPLLELDDAADAATLFALNGLSIDQLSTVPILNFTNSLDDQAGASVGTLNNAPGPGDPSKWFFIKDGGNNYAIPAWSFV